MPEEIVGVVETNEDKVLGEIHQSEDMKKILEYQKVNGIDLLVKKTYSSDILGKEVVEEREWDMNNPRLSPEGKIAGYDIKETTKRITKE